MISNAGVRELFDGVERGVCHEILATSLPKPRARRTFEQLWQYPEQI